MLQRRLSDFSKKLEQNSEVLLSFSLFLFDSPFDFFVYKQIKMVQNLELYLGNVDSFIKDDDKLVGLNLL